MDNNRDLPGTYWEYEYNIYIYEDMDVIVVFAGGI